jgi:hypothetical protein
MILWTAPELASGIVAMCLPVSPRFFRHFKDSNFWSGLKFSIRSFSRPKTEAEWTTDTYAAVGENKASNGSSGSFKVKIKESNIFSDETELATMPKDGSGRSTRDEEVDETLSKAS